MGKRFPGMENVDISSVAKGYFGFTGCCLDYTPASPSRKGKRIFVETILEYNDKGYEWMESTEKNYRKRRVGDFFKMDGSRTMEMIKVKKVKDLFGTLDNEKAL